MTGRCACGAVVQRPVVPSRPGERRPCMGPAVASRSAVGDAPTGETSQVAGGDASAGSLDDTHLDLGGEG